MRCRVFEGACWPLIFLVWLPSVLLASSLHPKRRDTGDAYQDWRTLWYGGSNSASAIATGGITGGQQGGVYENHGGVYRPQGFLDDVDHPRPQVYSHENYTAHNVTVQLGATAFLHCHVRNVGERGQISWVRRRDWHILSSGAQTYTNDERFGVLHSEGSDLWTLQIKYVQKRDNGTYECQVATGHGVISHFANLQIVVPEAFILGSGEHHVDVGSIISLVCIIEKSPTPPQYVFWYHNTRMINYDTSRGGITVETEPGPRTQSRLTIRDTAERDTGNYTCSASNTEPASIYVFVSEGDKMAAILRRKTSNSAQLKVTNWSIYILVTLLSTLFSR